MTGPVNPILVVKNNLPEFAQELHDDRIKCLQRLKEIDEQMIVLVALAAVVGVDIGTTTERAAALGLDLVLGACAPDCVPELPYVVGREV